MFGTIAHVRPKSGHEDRLGALLDEWKRTIRPRVEGRVLGLSGRAKDSPDERIFIYLFQDEATYRQMAAVPEQDAWYRKLVEHLEGEPRWEDVELKIDVQD